jgi:hypothetical protein
MSAIGWTSGLVMLASSFVGHDPEADLAAVVNPCGLKRQTAHFNHLVGDGGQDGIVKLIEAASAFSEEETEDGSCPRRAVTSVSVPSA